MSLRHKYKKINALEPVQDLFPVVFTRQFFAILGADADAYPEGTLEGGDDEGRKTDRKDDREKILNRLLGRLTVMQEVYYA